MFKVLLRQLNNNLQQGKLLIFLLGGALAGLNWTLDPSIFVTVPADDCPRYLELLQNNTCPINKPAIRAAGFTLITAVALFASVLSSPRTLVDWIVERGIRLLGVASAFGAGWFWLEAETYGHPWAYVGSMFLIVGLGAYTMIGGGYVIAVIVFALRLVWFVRIILFNLLILTVVWSALFLVANILCLWAFGKLVWQSIRDIYRHIRHLLP